MRIALISHYFASHGGGVELVAWRLAQSLLAEGKFEFEWCAAACDPAPPPHEGLRCTPLSAWNGLEQRLGTPYPIPSASAALRIWNAVREADVVHIHECQYAASLLAAVFARLLSKPLVVTQHVGEVPYESRLLRMALSLINRLGGALVLRSASEVVFVSPLVQQFFTSLVKLHNHRHVPNGVDTLLFRAQTHHCRQEARDTLLGEFDHVLLFVGRLVEKKGLGLVQMLAAARPRWKFVIVGQGPIDPAAWGLPNICLMGAVQQSTLRGLYCAADLLLLPSVGEGFPLVVQEALACGCVVAVSEEIADAGALPDAFALRAPPGGNNVVTQWREVLDRYLCQPLEIKELGRAAASKFAREQWSWTRTAKEYFEIFSRL